MPSVYDIITDLLVREGPETNDPHDGGGRTKYGISERSNPEAWADGDVTEAEARAIYGRKYVEIPGFNRIPPDERLKVQLIDFGINSGPQTAIMKLQTALNLLQPVHLVVDGVLGPVTLLALSIVPQERVNNRLAIERIKMIGKIVKSDPSQLRFIDGWLNRATSFILPA